MNKPLKSLTALAALFALHGAAQATYTGPNCVGNTNVDVNVDIDYDIDPAKGVVVQLNKGDNDAFVDLRNVIMRKDGAITATAVAIGNNAVFEATKDAPVTLKTVYQQNRGDNTAVVKLLQNSKSQAGQIELSSLAIGNNFGANTNGASLVDLSITQCNVGDNYASVNYKWDPTSLKATATAIGNNISVSTKVQPVK